MAEKMPNISGETNIPIGDWTIGSLKIYQDSNVSALKELHEDRIDHVIESIDKNDRRYQERWQAQENAAKALKEYQNEFRGALDDLSTKQATKLEVTTAVDILTEKIEAQTKLIGALTSRLDLGNPELRTLQAQQSQDTGKSMGLNAGWIILLGLVSLLGGLSGLISFFSK